ncbi:hypothetical protein [Sphingobacterium deserti]|uniref:Uncharacterized protein n=1 Tax=Sphingobacterium deserti TaxID=1229276 RepID=A0A0B8T5K6_9SPHI|nr:hypothetical protein [Sphingobacterium deserti]KGE12954.1 hypothetical protein DI53_3171 [Sphingobacterium deserti]
MYTFKLKARHYFAYLFLITLASCSKERINIQNTNKDAQLMFIISEQTGGSISKTSNLRASSSAAITTYTQEESEQHQFTEDGAFRITTSLSTAPISAPMEPKSMVSNKPLSSRMSSTQASSSNSVLKDGTKYRVVLYDRSTTPSKFASTSLGIAGQRLLIDVEKGKSYDWAVFSYNDENDPGESQDVITPTTGLKDLLHAKGTTEVVPGYSGDEKEVVMPINVLLQHKLANVSVHVSVKEYPAKIISLSASLGRNTYFCKNTLDLKTGEFVQSNTQIPIGPAMNFVSNDGDSVMVANYYTSKFKSITGFSVTLNSLSIRTGANEIKSLNSPSIHHWEMSPAQGQRNVARINIQPVRDISGDKFKILSVGSSHYSLAPNQPYSGSWHALHSEKNFGPKGTYPTTNLKWNVDYRSSPLGAFDNLSAYKMVFIGYFGGPLTDNDVRQLINYIENGGTVIWSIELPISHFEKLVWQRFAGDQASEKKYTGYGVPFSDSELLNGPFGDARNTMFGNYAMAVSGTGVSNFSEPVIELAKTSSGVAAVWKARDYDFYYFGSAGMQKYSSTPVLGVNPFLLTASPDYVPKIGAWSNQERVSNSVMLMNIVAKTMDKVLGTGK